jgi:RimJ/RimL family protein N-acetyltransferase
MSFIETPRLILRTWMVSDLDAYAAIAADADVMRYLPGGPLTRDETRSWIERAMHEQEHEGFSLWPVVDKERGRIVGRCGLHRFDAGEVEIAWLLDRSVWGRGYASEAAAAVVSYAFTVAKLPQICALIDPRNERSIAVAHGLHMRFDRVVRAYSRELLKYVI